MQNAGITIGMVAIGLGLASIGLNLNGNQANATTAAPVAFNAGPAKPTIVWYGLRDIERYITPGGVGVTNVVEFHAIYRAWSDGTIERRVARARLDEDASCDSFTPTCISPWAVISSPNEGLNAAADINHDEIVNAADIGLLVAAWGDAPRNPMPPSDCPLGLIP
ncbi:hypothetical protein OAR33_00585 [bacterium]|nr:hypothetical protein [bacterium]